MAANATFATLPPLPEYSLQPRPTLVSWMSDKTLAVVTPIAVYWIVSIFWHIVDTLDLFPAYRLHTPAEILKRNHAGRWEVFRDVIVQQVIQFFCGYILNLTEPDDVVGSEPYDIAVWAQRLRLAQHAIPSVLAPIGIDASGLSQKYSATYPNLSAVLAGGVYPGLVKTAFDGSQVADFASWETSAARIIYSYLVPALQFWVAIVVLDSWQYFLHRAMHMNKWLYTTFHSRHHRLYVPYAYGALYNHPFEGFLLDTLGAGLAFKVAGLSVRQGLCFFACTTVKTIDDHCGYHLPWDPLQLLTGNNAAYHDVHHQSWGIKTNFSQPFFTFWDRLLDTRWKGGDVSAKYERARLSAQRQVEQDKARNSVSASNSTASAASTFASDGMKGLRDRVGGGHHSRKGSLLGVEH